MPEQPKKPLIPGRVMLIGEEVVPKEVIQELQDHHVQVFMREPDPRKWPREIEHLIYYLPSDERIAFVVSAVLATHDYLLMSSLENWAASVWTDVKGEVDIAEQNREVIVEEMVKHLKDVLRRYVAGL